MSLTSVSSEDDRLEKDSIATINCIIKRGVDVHKQCMNKKNNWSDQLISAQKETQLTVHTLFDKAKAFIQLWEDQFNKEVQDAYSKIIDKETREVEFLLDKLNRAMFTIMGKLKPSSHEKGIPFEDANNLLVIISNVHEKMKQLELVPPIMFHQNEGSLNDIVRFNFGYLSTLDVSPRQLILSHPPDIVPGPMVFVVHMPQMMYKAELAEVLVCTITVQDKKTQVLKAVLHDNCLEISVEISSPGIHTMNVQLYYQHISGSPFIFCPSVAENYHQTCENVNEIFEETRDDFSSSSSLEFTPKKRIQIRAANQALKEAQRDIYEHMKKYNEVEDEAHKAILNISPKKKLSTTEYLFAGVNSDNNNNPKMAVQTQPLIKIDHQIKKEPFIDGNMADDEGELSSQRSVTYEDQRLTVNVSGNKGTNSGVDGTINTQPLTLKQEAFDGVFGSVQGEVKVEPVSPNRINSKNNKPKVARNCLNLNKLGRRPRIPAAFAETPSEEQMKTVSLTEKSNGKVKENDSEQSNNESQLIKSMENLELENRNPLKTIAVDSKQDITEHRDSPNSLCSDSLSSEKLKRKSNPELSARMVYKVCGPSSDPLLRPIGVAELMDKTVVVTDTFNDRVALFNDQGMFVKYFRTSSMSRPSAIVVLRNGKFAVKDNHSITIFQPKGAFERTIATGLRKPYGLTMNGEGNLVTVQTTNQGYATLLMINPDTGETVKQLRVELCHPCENKRLASKPRFISYHKDGRILIVDLGLNCIFVVDILTGKLLFEFGETGHHPGKFNDPSGIACDSDGYILVGDSRNHRVQVFDPNGQFVCLLSTDTKLCRPSGICLTSRGYLYIINYWDNSLAKYSMV